MSRTRRIFGRLARVFAVLLAVIVLVIGAALAFSQTATFRAWLRQQVMARADAALNGRVAIGNLEGDLLGSLAVTDLQVTMDGATLLTVPRLTAAYGLMELITTRRLVLHHVTVDGIHASLVQDSRGWNVVRLIPPSATVEENKAKAGAGLAVDLEDLTITGGSLDVVRPASHYTLRDINLRGSANLGAKDRSLQLLALSFHMPEREVRVERLSGQVDLAADGGLTAKDLVLKTAASSARADGTIGSGLSAYDLRIDVDHLSADEVHRFLGGNQPATDLHGTLRARGPARALSLDGTTLHSDAGSVALAGTIDIANPLYAYDLRLALERLDLAALAGPAQPQTNLNGTVTLHGTGTTLEQAAGTFAVALDRSIIRDTMFERLSTDGSIEDRRVKLNAAMKTSVGDATLTGAVNLADQQYDLRLNAEEFDPSPFLNRKELSPARINGSLSIIGAGFAPQSARADAQLTVAPSRVGPIEVRALDSKLHIADAQLTVAHFTLDSDLATAEATGSIGLGRVLGAPNAAPPSGTLHYTVQVADLGPAGRLIGAGPIEGSFTLQGTAAGRIDALDIASSVTGKHLAAKGARIDAIRLQATGHAIGSAQAAAEVTAHAQGIEASGRQIATADSQVHWKQVSTERSDAAIDLVARQDDQHTHTIRVSAEMKPIETRAFVQTLALQVGDETWRTTGTPQIVRRGDRFTVTGFDLRSQHGTITLAGEGGMTGREDVTLTVQNLDVAQLESWLPGNVKGRVSARAHLTGTAGAPQADAEATIEHPTIEKITYDSMRVGVQMRPGTATVNALVVQSGERQMVLDAHVPAHTSLSPWHFAIGESVSGTLRATQIDLAFLNPFITQVSELRGTLTADLSMSGQLQKPELRGTVSIADAGARVMATGVRYNPIELRAHVDGSSVQIDTLRIVSGDGSLTGGGKAQLAQADVAGEAKFQLDHFPFLDNQYGEGRVSGWLWVSGNAQKPIIEGALETERLVFRIPEQLPGAAHPPDPTIVVIGPNAPAPPVQTAANTSEPQVRRAADAPEPPARGAADAPRNVATSPGLYQRAAIHVDMNVPHNAWLKRSDANVELRGWLTTWKTPQQPVHVAGEIDAVRGWYTFQNKKFTVSEGQVTLTGQDFDPLMNILATHQEGDYTVKIHIGGKLTKPTIKLESDPALDQGDILSVLVFGKPARELNKGQSRDLRDRALGVASGYAASELRQSVAQALGVDNLEVDPSSAGLGETSATVGKYVSQDVFVSISHKFAQQSVEQLRVQYFLTPRWTIETATDTKGDSGVDVFWKRRY